LIPVPFTYQRAWSVDEALELAIRGGEDAKFLAGGHSLLPLMKLRLAVPEILIDIGRIRELSYIHDEGHHIAVGALTSHHDLALDATLVARGPSGSREIGSGEFFRGLFETALQPGELLTEVRIPRPQAAGWSFQKFTKRAIDWAIVGVAVQGSSVALVNMGQTPLRASAVEQALASGAGPAAAAARAAEGLTPSSDLNASQGYREHLARVLVGRALEESASRA
jgi:carbon-monoxide dehydrogenase medium subunit